MAIGAASPLRTPVVAVLIILVLIWTMMSLDMPSIRKAPHVDQTTPDYSYDAAPSNLDNAESLRIASEAAAQAATAPALDVIPTGAPVIGNPYLEAEKGAGTKGKPTDKPLILYAYADAESGSSRINLEFFIAHALHDAADFVFILNGETTVGELIPIKSNIKIVQRANDCYDLGAYAEVLLKDDLYKGYKRFITLNASIRGPFVPYWSDACWSDMYLNKVTDEVKLVGMTANCWPTFHIQSMIWATDITGLETLLFPPQAALDHLAAHPIKFPPTGIHDAKSPGAPPALDPNLQIPGINACFHNWDEAVAAEVSSTSLIRAAGYKVDAMMSAMQGIEAYKQAETCVDNNDVLWDGKYWGSNVGLYETGWMKSNRDVDPVGLQMQSEWVKGRKYSSYDYCKL